MRQKQNAFTLVELLVVVSIIALLIAILLPALKHVRYNAKLSECTSRLRQIGAIQLAYAVDNDSFFPEAGGYRYGSNTDGVGGPETGGWPDAANSHGARIRGWELTGSIGDGWTGAVNKPINKRGYDLRQTYYDYMQNDEDMEATLHCPFIHKGLKDYYGALSKEDKTSSYMMYTTNNYRTKHFYYEDVGAYERLGDTWSPFQKPDEDFTILASDFAFGNFAPHGQKDENGDPYRGALTAHPATNGSIYEHASQLNDAPGYVVDETQDAPTNYADADGSVQMFKINGGSYKKTDEWVVNDRGNHRTAMMPKALVR